MGLFVARDLTTRRLRAAATPAVRWRLFTGITAVLMLPIVGAASASFALAEETPARAAPSAAVQPADAAAPADAASPATAPSAVTPPAATPRDAALHDRVTALGKPNGDSIGGVRIAARDFLPRLYAALGYELAWRDPQSVKKLQDAVARSWEDGLLASDFHQDVIAAALPETASHAQKVDRDIILSDALVRLLYQLYFGKVDPKSLDSDWNFDRPVVSSEPSVLIAEALKSGKISELVDRVRLPHPFYQALKATLQSYTEHAVSHTWVLVPEGQPLKPGDSDPRVPALRARLLLTGEYPEGNAPTDPNIYDDALVEAVKKFQAANSLDADGVIGPATVKTLNATPEDRVEQIRVNLERARWILRDIGDDMVIVNIAGFYLRLVLKGKPVWNTRVVVGKTYHKTPIFTETMKTIVLNPDWSLPRSIVRNEKFAKMSNNPGYLASNDYELRDGSGNRVDPSAVDWSRYSSKTFPYSMVQKPGPKNALGLVKFLFPNKYSVYLHDTPSRQFFDKAGRTFSHGCIRVKDPLKLAGLILGRSSEWDQGRVDALVKSGKTHWIKLENPLPVLLLYWTVDPTFDGGARFYQDVYGRDQRLLAALNAPFKPRQAKR